MFSFERWALVASAAAVAVLAACDTDTYVIDPFPVSVDYSENVPHLKAGVVAIDGLGFAEAVIDTGSAVSRADGDATNAARVRSQIDLFSATELVPRARFLGGVVLARKLAGVGLSATGTDAPLLARIVIGADLLSQLDTRLDPGHGEAFFFPNLAGDTDVLARECSAVFEIAPAGGGRFALGSGTVSYARNRLVVGACLDPDMPPATEPVPPATRPRPAGAGADALLLIATGTPITVLSRSAYERATGENVDALPTSFLFLPGSSGPSEATPVHLGSLDALAIADQLGKNRGPCAELRASRLMDVGGRVEGEPSFCASGENRVGSGFGCAAGASMEVAQPLPVAIVEDTDPLLQGLRAELAPEVASIDGLLGMDALLQVVTDLDYPNARVVIRCADGAGAACVVRPRIDDLGQTKSGGALVQCKSAQLWKPTP